MPVTSEEEDEDEDVTLHSEEDASHSEVSTSDYEDDDELPPRQPFSQHTFAPPFYGRPPTPLPPSPSLTSLLRPSRPTTPDASDDDAEQLPVPRASPQVPTYEYYGFVLYLLSSLGFLIYLLWSYLPSPLLHALGIYYYPNRWWSLAIPSFLVVLFVYIYVALAAYNTEVLTLPLSSIETVVDDTAQIAVLDSRGRIRDDEKRKTDRRRAERESRRQQQQQGQRGQRRGGRDDGDHNGSGRRGEQERDLLTPAGGLNWREVWNEGTDAVMDIPLAGVCEVLYGEGRDMSDEDDDDGGMITRL